MKIHLLTWITVLILPLTLCAAPKFLDQQEAALAIVDDRADPYFSQLQPLEIGAKCGVKDSAKSLAELRETARQTYAAEVKEFTPAEKQMLSWVTKQLQPVVEAEFPLVSRTPWTFLKVSGKLEGGLPHTRGACIVLAEPFLTRMMGGFQPAKLGFLRYFLGKLVLHEQVHVVQRLQPNVFPPLYTKVWGFRRAPHIESHPWLIARNVVNPDGADTGWVYPLKSENGKVRWIWPLLILNGPGGKTEAMPQDFQLVAINVVETGKGFKVQTLADGKPDFHPVAEVPEYARAFPTLDETYHPNEIVADLIASYIAQRSLIPQGARVAEEPSLEKCGASLEWLKANLR